VNCRHPFFMIVGTRERKPEGQKFRDRVGLLQTGFRSCQALIFWFAGSTRGRKVTEAGRVRPPTLTA
jgi:hypothetical protein